MNVLLGWVHNDRDVERIPRDASLDSITDKDPFLPSATVTRALPTLPVGPNDDGLVPSNVHGGDAYTPEEPACVTTVKTAATGT